MQKIENVTLYKCDYCSKVYRRRHAGEWHEKHCSLNPNNQHACFRDCAFLLKESEEDCDRAGERVTRRVFRCTKLDKYLYSYVAERRRLLEAKDDSERMPLNCDHFEINMRI